jgi:hypothetical protein
VKEFLSLEIKIEGIGKKIFLFKNLDVTTTIEAIRKSDFCAQKKMKKNEKKSKIIFERCLKWAKMVFF